MAPLTHSNTLYRHANLTSDFKIVNLQVVFSGDLSNAYDASETGNSCGQQIFHIKEFKIKINS